MSIDLELIQDSDHLLDILLQVENVLDSLDAYCFSGWFDGEVVSGPIVKRYWVTISLRYKFNKMPDPRFALRLLKHGVQVEFDRMKETERHGESEQPKDWLVTISCPRRLLDQNQENDLKVYADDINPDDIETAKDTGLDNESQYKTDEQVPDEDGAPPPPDQAASPEGAPPVGKAPF